MSSETLLQMIRQLVGENKGGAGSDLEPAVKARGLDLLKRVANVYMAQPEKATWDAVRDLEVLRQQIQVDPNEEPPQAISDLYYSLAYL